jgi:hypothetical protein
VSQAHLKYQEPYESTVLEMMLRDTLYQWFPKWALPPLVGVGLPRGALRGKGVLGMGPSVGVVRLFTIEMTLDQTFENWYHFIKPTHRIKNLLT